MDKLWDVVDNVSDYLRAKGIELPEEVKRRDRKEPGRLRKEALELKLAKILRKYFKEQSDRVESLLVYSLPIQIKSDLLGDNFWAAEDETLITLLTNLLTQASKEGVDLFAEGERIGLDYSMSNVEAMDWARKYSYDLVKGINKVNREAISKAVQNFVDTPGMTLKDIMNKLPYSDERAMKIAITETTRAYAEGNQLAGEQLKKEYPDVRVIKHWYTNNDDRVCVICGPLNGEEVDIDENFSNGEANPPAHVNCRCWTSTTTRLRKDG